MNIIRNFKDLTWREKSTSFYKISLITPMFIGAWAFIGLFGILLGWIGLLSFDPNIGFPWLANIIYFLLLIRRNMNPKVAFALALIMIVFGLFAIGITTVPRDEGGGNYNVFVGFGFVLWILSFVFMLIEQWKRLKNKNDG